MGAGVGGFEFSCADVWATAFSLLRPDLDLAGLAGIAAALVAGSAAGAGEVVLEAAAAAEVSFPPRLVGGFKPRSLCSIDLMVLLLGAPRSRLRLEVGVEAAGGAGAAG